MKHILTGKVLIIIFIIVALFVTGCLLWSQRDLRIANEELAATEERLQKVEERKSKPVERLPDQISTDDSEITEADPGTGEERVEVAPEGTDTISDTDTRLEINDASEAETEETPDAASRESLFGFGAYPEVPLELFPKGEGAWDNIESTAKDNWEFAKKIELMVRVRIQLWELGTETVGASMENGLIYPNIPNIAYVEWGDWKKNNNGEPIRTVKRISSAGGLSDGDKELIRQGGTPPGWTIMDRDTAGIDPYTFLDLGR